MMEGMFLMEFCSVFFVEEEEDFLCIFVYFVWVYRHDDDDVNNLIFNLLIIYTVTFIGK